MSLSAVALAVASIPMFAAFEAHVINVTARIENALTVDTTPIEYGTVFPQEKLDKFVYVRLSGSFIEEPRVDDIDYVIKQKPKCGKPVPGTNPVEYSDYQPTIGHNPQTGAFICPDGFVPLPLLCPYLSKHEVTTDGRVEENDGRGLPAFHGEIDHWGLDSTNANKVTGHLAKSQEDTADQWKIDLRTPCFEGQCAQDWEQFVRGENPDADPAKYVQPSSRQHQIFGCDLWLEVFGISLPGLGCTTVDLMLVLDRSGSIDDTELGQLKTAAKAFVDAVHPSGTGTHVGQSSFATTGTLDRHLTGDGTAVKAAIDALVNAGFTNLKEGIELATGEVDNGHEHERPATPDFMVIITDGRPNRPNGNEALDKTAAEAAADAAKAAGVEIYVVGVGSDVDADFLRNDIASGADHYFSAADFASLEAELAKLAECPA